LKSLLQKMQQALLKRSQIQNPAASAPEENQRKNNLLCFTHLSHITDMRPA